MLACVGLQRTEVQSRGDGVINDMTCRYLHFDMTCDQHQVLGVCRRNLAGYANHLEPCMNVSSAWLLQPVILRADASAIRRMGLPCC